MFVMYISGEAAQCESVDVLSMVTCLSCSSSYRNIHFLWWSRTMESV